MRACLVILTSLFAGPPAGDGSSSADIGWCAFYPSVDVGMDRLPESGASILSVCAGGWGMARGEGTYDFSAFDKQLAYARQYGLKLALISEINPLYTPAWLQEKVRAVDQLVQDANGEYGSIPSITSPLFTAAQEELVQRFVEHVRRTDDTGVVAYYHPGAEWWFPLNQRYHPGDVARFRGWLREQYGSIDKLNATWQSGYTSFDDIAAPAIDMLGGGRGRTGLAAVISLEAGAAHCSWSTPAAIDPAAVPAADTYAAVQPGRRYTVSAWVNLQSVAGPGAYLEVAWVGPEGGRPMAIDDGRPLRAAEGWTQLEEVFTAPKGAGRAWVLLKFMGSGTVMWDDVVFRETDGGANLAPNPNIAVGDEQPAAWRFQNWSGGERVLARYLRSGGRSGSECLEVTVPAAEQRARGAAELDAAVHDWSVFWQETAAEYINGLARMFRRHDVTRPTITYLTMSWAFPAEWDETQRSAIAPDEVAMRGRDIDGFGMQLCSADGDPYRVTACLDLVRKYGKPMWTVDLVDFTSGVHIGYPTMDRITQSALQHGAAGIIYCAWHIPTVLDYSFYPNMDLNDTHHMLDDARRAVDIMAGLKIHARGAILQPILPATPSDPEGFKNDYRSFVGWYKLLESLQETCDVITLREIDQRRVDLSSYRYILVPDCACLPDAVREQLAAYGRAGGLLITGGRFADRDAIGRPLTHQSVARVALPDYGKAYAGDPIRDTHAGNTPPLFLWREETEATRRARREGHDALLKSLAAATITPLIELEPDDGSIRCVAWSGPDVNAVYLVNMSGAAVPADRLKLRMRCTAEQIRVYADTRLVPSDWEPDQAISLPPFRASCIVKAVSQRVSGRDR